MKINKILALSVTIASTQALAFQAKDTLDADRSTQQLRAAEENIIGSFYQHSGARAESAKLGNCAAVPVAGCGCPFCSMLRSQKR